MYFPGIEPDDATFVVLNARSLEIIRYNRSRAQRRFLPASTFKIPNSLIALATGVATGPDHLIAWDGTRPNDGSFWAASWSNDHTLRSAMRNSVVWYYQKLARQVGADRMQHYVRRCGSGGAVQPPASSSYANSWRLLDLYEAMRRPTGGAADEQVEHARA